MKFASFRRLSSRKLVISKPQRRQKPALAQWLEYFFTDDKLVGDSTGKSLGAAPRCWRLPRSSLRPRPKASRLPKAASMFRSGGTARPPR